MFNCQSCTDGGIPLQQIPGYYLTLLNKAIYHPLGNCSHNDEQIFASVSTANSINLKCYLRVTIPFNIIVYLEKFYMLWCNTVLYCM